MILNRNTESYFSTVPSLDISRSRFDCSQDIKFSFDVGELIPFYVNEILPGDTIEIETSKVCRLQTLLTPVMDNIYLDTYFFFVPYRLCWTHWKEFMGENTQSAWLPQVEYSIPQIYAYNLATADPDVGEPCYVHPGDYADYMGIPVGVPAKKGVETSYAGAKLAGECLSWSALPYRAAGLIWNEWFRDENLQDPLNIYLGDSDNRCLSNTEREAYGIVRDNLTVSKFHDYFTSALPAPLKGEPVLAPIESKNINGMPVGSKLTDHTFSSTSLHVRTGENRYLTGIATVEDTGSLQRVVPFVTAKASSESEVGPLNLYGDISSVGINIMSLRNAFQVQKLLERDARSGTRYTEIIKGHFSVSSPDSRLQRPEYLGGNRIAISIHQITNNSQGENAFLGDLGAMSLTTDKHSDLTYSSTEHGVIIGMCCARYDHSYPQGLERFWSRKTRFDFYWPEFANLSEMAVLNKEVYAQGDKSVDDQVFGFQECYADYRYKPNRVAGEMRPGINNTLASWHFADYYQSLPYLSGSWIKEDKTNVDRTLAVTSQVANQVFADIYVNCWMTRPMPVRSIPGLADHF